VIASQTTDFILVVVGIFLFYRLISRWVD